MTKEDSTIPSIAKQIGISRQAVRVIAKGLKNLRLLEYVNNPRKVRSPIIHATMSGKKAHALAMRNQRHFVKIVEENISDDQSRSFISTCHYITKISNSYANEGK